MKTKTTAVLLTVCLVLTLIAGGCASKNTNSSESQKILLTDTLARQVEVTAPVKGVVAIGPGSLRLYCYVNGLDKLVGVENFEMTSPIGRPYYLAHPELGNLPIIGNGGPNSTPDAEKILSVKPDVIFADSSLDKATADSLQAKTGIPVIVLNYGNLGTFDQTVYTSINMIGKAMGQEQRAQAVVDYMEKCKQDLSNRTKGIPDNQKTSVYVGAVGMKGTHGIQSTQGQYPPFVAVNARNVVDETGKSGSLTIDLEKLISWNPDKIFIDEAGFALVQQDYSKNSSYYKNLAAVKNTELYGILPFNYYTTNLDTAMADAYYIGKIIYPEQFKDIDPEKKADEIYSFLDGKPVYSQMAKDFGGFKKLSLE